MTRIKLLITVVLAGLIILAAPSCKKQPVACYNTSVPLDSIHANVPVTFNANCSVYADSYNWQFYNNQDCTAFTPIVTKTFRDTGTVNVYLLITGGGTDAGVNTNITVLR